MLFLKLLHAMDCEPPRNGIVLNHYSLKNCQACQKLAPNMEEIIEKAGKTNINLSYRKVECNDCECGDIEVFPTLKITDDKVEKSDLIGYHTYNDLAEWIGKTLKFDSKILTSNRNEHEAKIVKKLTNEDLSKGFDGNWIILFYDNNNEPSRKTMVELAEHYPSISVGTIHKDDAKDVLQRYNVTTFPYLLAINHGINVPYLQNLSNIPALDKFTKLLVTPAFTNLTYDNLKLNTKDHLNGEPTYIVLHEDNFEIASNYFGEIAQHFKFKTRIFRSDDKKMFEYAGFTPKSKEDSKNVNDQVQLFLYKNGSFFKSPFEIEDRDKNIRWIFHTHFPHLSSISSDNFYSVFHGIKPIMLLLTENDMFVKEFNELAAEKHLGLTSANVIFATIDNSEFPGFKKQVLNKTSFPSIVVFDPIEAKWYYKEQTLTFKNVKKVATESMDLFFNEKLPIYPPKKSNLILYLTGGAFIIIMLYLLASKMLKRNKIE